MKWLFTTLVALNIIVFAGIIASKMMKKQPAPAPVVVTQPDGKQTPVNITINNPAAAAPGAGNAAQQQGSRPSAPRPMTPRPAAPAKPATPAPAAKICSASVSIPEDDYHRIKGLLPNHAASRQVGRAENSGKDGPQSAARVVVVFPAMDDAAMGRVQSVVAPYGKLGRSCK